MAKLGAPLDANSNPINNLSGPTAAQDAATKAYVDASRQGLNAKLSVKAATTAAITTNGAQSIDGVSLVAGDRVLVKNQGTASQNGIYEVAAGAWPRSADADSWGELISAFVFVEQGSTQGDTSWLSTVDAGGTIGTTPVTIVQFGAASSYSAGSALTLTGSQFSVNVDNATIEAFSNALRIKDGGIGSGKLATGAVDLSTSVVTGTLAVAKGGTGQTTVKAARETGLAAVGQFSTTGPAAPGTQITVPQATHGLRATGALNVKVFETSSGTEILANVVVTTGGDVTVTSSASLATNAWTVLVQG